MKKISCLIVLIWGLMSVHAQVNSYMISVYSYSHDFSSINRNAGISTTIGNSYELLNLLKEYYFNTLQIEDQLFYGPHGKQYALNNPSKSFLDRADSLNLKIILRCPDMFIDRHDTSYYHDTTHTQFDSSNTASAVSYYGNHPALLGFSVSDEPHHIHFSDVSKCFSIIEQLNPDLLRAANLFPTHARDTFLGYPGYGYMAAYPLYVADFIETTRPNVVSFDNYPIYSYLSHCIGCQDVVWPNTFYFNFDVVARLCEQKSIPFIYVPTFIEKEDTSGHLLKNVDEFRYVTNTGLTLGAKGLNYWHLGKHYCLWECLSSNIKQYIANFHKTILLHEEILLSLHYKDSYHVTNASTVHSCPNCIEYIPAHMQWSAFGNDAFSQAIFNIANPFVAESGYSLDSLAVSFLFDNNGGKYFWVDNKSFRSSLQLQLNLNDSCSIVDVLEDQRCPQSGNVPIQLLPGEAKLFRAFFTNSSDTISSSVTWSQKRVQGQNLVVDSLSTLIITDTLFMANNARIIVRPGGKLIVDGGTLTSACAGEMWQGIEVVGDRTKHQTAAHQGTVILRNNATIENAHFAVRTRLGDDNWLTSGGIVQCSNSTFKNNRRAVEFLSYVDTISPGFYGDNKSWFKDCTFTLNDTNLFLSQGMQFLNHVTLWDVKGVSFEGCTFENLTTGNIPDRKRAIYAEGAGFSVRTLCNSLDGCNCHGAADTNVFRGFSTAVEVGNTGCLHTVTIDEARFLNNGTGVSIQACDYATVTRCTFDLSTNPVNTRNTLGLRLDNSSGFHVEGNSFTAAANAAPSLRWGVYVNKSMKLNNSIYRNTFGNLTRGITVSDTNGLGRTGLCFSCNTFEDCAYGMYVNTNGSIASMQGNINKGSDNTFSGTQTSSLHNLGPVQVNYYHSQGNSFILYNPTGVLTESNLAAVNPCNSTICDQSGNVTPVTGFGELVSSLFTPAGNSIAAAQNAPSLEDVTQTYYAAVRRIMADSVESLSDLLAWHAAAGALASPYALTETATAMGSSATVVSPMAATLTAGSMGASLPASEISQPEMDNYASFRVLADALRPSSNNPAVNWPSATPAQINELQRIAEANTGRSSVMAKGVLCFFFDICYEEAVEGETRGHLVETFHGTSLQDGAPGGLLVYPNPTDGTVTVEATGESPIRNVTVLDMSGRVMDGVSHTPQSENSYICTLNLQHLESGIYLIRALTADGKTVSGKVVKN